MELTIALSIHSLEENGERRIAGLGQYAEDLVAFVDECAGAVAERLVQAGVRVEFGRGDGYDRTVADHLQMVGKCRGDWILYLDQDEELSAEWRDPAWRELFRSGDYTHFWVLRRWLVTRERFLSGPPWWPDWQLRLFRNDPTLLTLPGGIHERITVGGEGGYLRHLAIHHDLFSGSRSLREAKVAKYDAIRPGGGMPHYYLWEDADPAQSDIPEAAPFSMVGALAQMRRLSEQQMRNIGVALAATPPRFIVNAIASLPVEISNRTDLPLLSTGSEPLNVSYHWRNASDQSIAVFDGIRTALPNELSPRNSTMVCIQVRAPSQGGDYLLQVAVVQERVGWCDGPNCGATVAVKVIES